MWLNRLNTCQLFQSSGMEINIVKLLILKQNIIQKIC